jgi:integrase
MGVSVRQKVRGGPWWVFIAHRGKRKSKCVGDKDAAKKLAKEIRQALAAADLGLLDEPASVGMTFGAYADQFLQKVAPDPNDPAHGLKRSSWKDYSQCVKNHLKPLLGERPLADIRRRDVKDLLVALRQRGLSATNVRKQGRVLSSILSEALDDELIAANPATMLRKHGRSKQKTVPKRIDPLTEEELNTLLTRAQTHAIARGTRTVFPFRDHYPFLLLLAHTGMRLGEAIALQWGDVDWRGRFVEVRRAHVRGELSVPKSGRTRRVDLSDVLYDTLRERYTGRFEKVIPFDPAVAAEQEARRAAALDEWIFPDVAGGPLDASNFRKRVFGPLLVAAELRKIRIHDLRHTYASLLFQKGAALHYVQEQLGHHSPAFTLERYTHLIPGNHQRFVNLLGKPAPTRTPAAPDVQTDPATKAPVKRKRAV